ncbi:MAG: cytochrome b5 domain-containing protein [Thermodesulfobacteriota bacterium]
MTMKKFTVSELKKFDGATPGKPIYFAFKGKVYDATNSPLFADGMHFEHPAGCDLTEYVEESPHGEEVMEELPLIGDLIE